MDHERSSLWRLKTYCLHWVRNLVLSPPGIFQSINSFLNPSLKFVLIRTIFNCNSSHFCIELILSVIFSTKLRIKINFKHVRPIVVEEMDDVLGILSSGVSAIGSASVS